MGDDCQRRAPEANNAKATPSSSPGLAATLHAHGKQLHGDSASSISSASSASTAKPGLSRSSPSTLPGFSILPPDSRPLTAYQQYTKALLDKKAPEEFEKQAQSYRDRAKEEATEVGEQKKRMENIKKRIDGFERNIRADHERMEGILDAAGRRVGKFSEMSAKQWDFDGSKEKDGSGNGDRDTAGEDGAG
ncbi:hypothetical protein P280DRAFT_334625 [Massarina eburnea CBS 473.64]|uniref:Uncharacterized protein n=1 Tax=Massarina eburnea CBS 473.64 TaxID=1395130 RepID=A0A6A6RJH6_9PLEO|nr:hypothetical protein P280DRAFT_334625 [Massarina eburnea CBS 473.64]